MHTCKPIELVTERPTSEKKLQSNIDTFYYSKSSCDVQTPKHTEILPTKMHSNSPEHFHSNSLGLSFSSFICYFSCFFFPGLSLSSIQIENDTISSSLQEADQFDADKTHFYPRSVFMQKLLRLWK